MHWRAWVVIPYQVRSYQTYLNDQSKRQPMFESRNPLSSQVISNTRLKRSRMFQVSPLVVIPYQVRSYQTYAPTGWFGYRWRVVIPYQVRSYQTNPLINGRKRPSPESRNPLSSQVISNLWILLPCPTRKQSLVVIPYQVRSYQTYWEHEKNHPSYRKGS